MNTMAVLEQVAAGTLSPEKAADLLMQAERAERELRRPAWIPKLVWTASGAVFAAFFAFLGVERSD